MNQKDDRTELQKRVAEEMAGRGKKPDDTWVDLADQETPDGVDDSQYLKDFKQSRVINWDINPQWLTLGGLVIITVIAIIVLSR